MIRMGNVAALGLLLTVSSSLYAEFSMGEMVEASKVALTEFRTANPEHVAHFTGYKVWKSGEDTKAKIYVNHDGMNMEYNFLCNKLPAKIDCHIQ